MSESAALTLDKLSYHYTTEWTRKHKQVLKNLSLEVKCGETFGFLGHNGAGKTTTIKCILGLIQPRVGGIRIFGKGHHDTSARAAIGYVPEQPYFYEYLTVQESMLMYACLSNVPANGRAAQVKRALERVRLTGRERSRVRSLSKGLMQRLAMAQAIVHQPRLLILDEPFSGLDPIGRKEFRELLVELKREGTTIFMSSHILSDVEFLCDRVSILSHGELKGVFETQRMPETMSGHFELILRAPADIDSSVRTQLQELSSSLKREDRFYRLSFADRTPAETALKLAIQHNIGIESFEFVHGSLEDLFMKLVSFDEGASRA